MNVSKLSFNACPGSGVSSVQVKQPISNFYVDQTFGAPEKSLFKDLKTGDIATRKNSDGKNEQILVTYKKDNRLVFRPLGNAFNYTLSEDDNDKSVKKTGTLCVEV